MYGIRILLLYFIKYNTSNVILSGNVYNEKNNMQSSSKASEKSLESISESNSNVSSGVMSKIMNYHYRKTSNGNEIVSSKSHRTSTKSSCVSNK